VKSACNKHEQGKEEEDEAKHCNNVLTVKEESRKFY
jgi:hypothetical protein